MDRNSAFLHADKREIFHNARLKQYPDGAWEMMVCNRPVFRDPGWEIEKNERPLAALSAERSGAQSAAKGASPESPETPTAANTERAARRAAARIRDIALCNSFAWFVTLTLDASKIDRYDVREITKRLNRWLDNRVRRDGLKYVLVPERHQDGALHFHGFINEQPGLVPSGTWSIPGHKKPVKPRSAAEAARWAEAGDAAGYHEVFNWDSWGLGFSTAIRLYGDYSAAVAYVCKYIRKQQEAGKIGGRWYYSGGALATPEVIRCDSSLDDLMSSQGAYSFEVPEAKLIFGILRGRDE